MSNRQTSPDTYEAKLALLNDLRHEGDAILARFHSAQTKVRTELASLWTKHGAEILVRLMKLVSKPTFGLLPDFGNFYGATDRYDAVTKMMPYAKGVSFKCWDFGADGKETKMDIARLMKIVKDAGYRGYVGIEYEGERMAEYDGIAAGKKLLDTIA